MLIGGIDEAGRGSVIGPLVIAGISFKDTQINNLKMFGIMDSKKLSAKRRLMLFDSIVKMSESIFICKVGTSVIDTYVYQNKLNKLEAKFMTIVADNISANKIIVDSCDVKPERFKREIEKELVNKKVTIYSFHKADLDHVIVSSASIIAKVTRDREIRKIEESLSQEIGSGYPSDRKTQAFLDSNLKSNIFSQDSAKYIRFSWKPVKVIIEKSKQTKLL